MTLTIRDPKVSYNKLAEAIKKFDTFQSVDCGMYEGTAVGINLSEAVDEAWGNDFNETINPLLDELVATGRTTTISHVFPSGAKLTIFYDNESRWGDHPWNMSLQKADGSLINHHNLKDNHVRNMGGTFGKYI